MTDKELGTTTEASNIKHVEDRTNADELVIPGTGDNAGNEKGYLSSAEASLDDEEDFEFTFGKFMAMLVCFLPGVNWNYFLSVKT
jgi:hypothetical protein